MKITKEKLRLYFHKRVDNCENELDLGTLMNVLDWLREYKE